MCGALVNLIFSGAADQRPSVFACAYALLGKLCIAHKAFLFTHFRVEHAQVAWRVKNVKQQKYGTKLQIYRFCAHNNVICISALTLIYPRKFCGRPYI